MKKIPLSKGQIVLVDDENYPSVSVFNWHIGSHGYAVRVKYAKKEDGSKTCKSILMHRVIMDAPSGMFVDHINGNKLDNRRANLRICTQGENARNRGKQCNNASGCKGVTWYARTSKWRASIVLNKKHIHLGYFELLSDASRAYENAAEKYHGEFVQKQNNL
jgi:hypothetical protein